MKRKPIEIMADVINTLNGLQMNKEYNINEIKKRSQIHWETALNYTLLIQFIQEYAPKIHLNAEKKNFQLITHSKQMGNFNIEDQMILYLFLEKAFSLSTATKEFELWNKFLQSKIKSIENSKFFEIEKNMNEKQFYLNRKGKFKAQGLLASINNAMGLFIDNLGQKNQKKRDNFVIKPFRCEKSAYLLRKTINNDENRKNGESDQKSPIQLYTIDCLTNSDIQSHEQLVSAYLA